MSILHVVGARNSVRADSTAGTYSVATLDDVTVVTRTLSAEPDEVNARVESCAVAISAALESGQRTAGDRAARTEVERLASAKAWESGFVTIDEQAVSVATARLLGGECAAYGSLRGIAFRIGATADLDALAFTCVLRGDALAQE